MPLDFHHVVPESKLFNISDYRHANDPVLRRANLDAYMAEISKCILLCPKHHHQWHVNHRRQGK
jgi:hypothetical protein